MKRRLLGVGLLLLGVLAGQAQNAPVTLAIHADRPGAKISPTMWGIFFEDINFGADGGLYAELIKNRSFEFPEPLMGWHGAGPAGGVGSIGVRERDPVSAASPHYVHVETKEGRAGIANEGFRGIGVREGARYRFSAFLRPAGTSETAVPVQLALVGANGAVLAEASVTAKGPGWSKVTATLQAKATDLKAHFELLLQGRAGIDADAVSLFPEDTWKHRPNGLRADLVQLLADLKPGFMRFPGGCIVEGHRLDTRYQWKATLGRPEDRHLILNRWNDEFKHRPAPDYFESFGLGFYEFFQLCEDIGAEPVPILNCGMACQFNSGELVPLDQLDPFIQDALDLVEFANGPVTSPWGRQRAQMGHPAPFHLKMLGVGNEQWGPAYFDRYVRFAKALKAAHPEIKLISSAGPSPADDRFQFAWPKLRELHAEVVDEHCYDRPDWFLNNSRRYDSYDRSGPKVFMGEYAAQSVRTVSPDNRNDWECALSEAAYMTGLERNADVVTMSSYAPLFAHVDAWQWTPDLIWFDNLRAYGTPNYYVQQLFSRNRGDVLLPTQLTGAPEAANHEPRFYASAVRELRSGDIILKVVNATAQPVPVHLELAGIGKVRSEAHLTLLSATDLHAVNSLKEPRRVAPRDEVLQRAAPAFEHSFPPESLSVLRISTP